MGMSSVIPETAQPLSGTAEMARWSPAAHDYFRLAQKRWMRVQASSSTASEVA